MTIGQLARRILPPFASSSVPRSTREVGYWLRTGRATWMDPFDIGESTMLIPDLSGALGNGVVLQNTRWARRADLPPAWKALTWQGREE